MKRRAIDPEESALWHEAMRDVKRNRGTASRADLASGEGEANVIIVPAKTAPQGNVLSLTVDSRLRRNDGSKELGAGLDRRQALRLKRGQLPVEARLDLHGMTQAEAHRALAGFLARSHAAGKRVLLVITGKGLKEGSGVLRAAVPRWLGEPALAALVLATAPAVARDGGAGALYVLLRRAR